MITPVFNPKQHLCKHMQHSVSPTILNVKKNVIKVPSLYPSESFKYDTYFNMLQGFTKAKLLNCKKYNCPSLQVYHNETFQSNNSWILKRLRSSQIIADTDTTPNFNSLYPWNSTTERATCLPCIFKFGIDHFA